MSHMNTKEKSESSVETRVVRPMRKSRVFRELTGRRRGDKKDRGVIDHEQRNSTSRSKSLLRGIGGGG